MLLRDRKFVVFRSFGVLLVVVFFETHHMAEYLLAQRESASEKFSIGLPLIIMNAHFTYLFHMNYSVLE